MKINKRHAQRAAALVGVVSVFCYLDGNVSNVPQRLLSEESPIAVSAEVKLESDAADKHIDTPSDYYKQHNYCTLDSRNNNKQCKETLTGALKSKPHWHFFGDSNMATLFTHLKPLYPHEVTIKRNESRTRDKCALLEYFDMKEPSVWVPPNVNLLQGPVAYGLHNPFCSDMMGWAPNMIGNLERSIEFLNVEFAQDVEYPTETTSTTQETAALYLTNENKDNHVCVVNAGTHDHEISKSLDTPPDQFVDNVQTYLRLLDSVCGNIVWISITAMNEKKWPTAEMNKKSMEWNQKVSAMVSRAFPDNSFIIDVWDESVATPFRGEDTNKLHFDDSYYDNFASLFSGLLE